MYVKTTVTWRDWEHNFNNWPRFCIYLHAVHSAETWPNRPRWSDHLSNIFLLKYPAPLCAKYLWRTTQIPPLSTPLWSFLRPVHSCLHPTRMKRAFLSLSWPRSASNFTSSTKGNHSLYKGWLALIRVFMNFHTQLIHFWRYERSSRLIRNLSNCEREAWKKIQTSAGFEPVTSAIPVQCSTNWAMKP